MLSVFAKSPVLVPYVGICFQPPVLSIHHLDSQGAVLRKIAIFTP